MLSYTYDAWGNATVSGNTSLPANKNPFRYRGYYYDADLGLYYLNSRYYDSNTGRFINADGYVSTGQGLIGYNMYTYCNNNPVMYVDYYGELPQWLENLKDKAKEKAKKGINKITDWLSFNSSSVEMNGNNFEFDANPGYSFLNAHFYAKHLKENYYADDPSRTVDGLYVELQAHYIAYLMGNSHGLDGAYMGEADWSGDWTAALSEVFGTGLRIVRKSLKPKPIYLYAEVK